MLASSIDSGLHRSEVHDIFSPDTKFVAQAGSWGLVGIVRIPYQAGDFVFFVTFGQKQGHHEFDEAVTERGGPHLAITASAALVRSGIRQIDPNTTNQKHYLPLSRATADKPYTFMGTLEYLNHDDSREQPVFFEWQIMDWKVPSQAILSRIGLTLAEAPEKVKPSVTTGVTNTLVVSPPPQRKMASSNTKSSSAMEAGNLIMPNKMHRTESSGVWESYWS